MGQKTMKISRWKINAISYVFFLKSVLIMLTGFILDTSQHCATLLYLHIWNIYLEYLFRYSAIPVLNEKASIQSPCSLHPVNSKLKSKCLKQIMCSRTFFDNFFFLWFCNIYLPRGLFFFNYYCKSAVIPQLDK